MTKKQKFPASKSEWRESVAKIRAARKYFAAFILVAVVAVWGATSQENNGSESTSTDTKSSAMASGDSSGDSKSTDSKSTTDGSKGSTTTSSKNGGATGSSKSGYNFLKPEAKTKADIDVKPQLKVSSGTTGATGEAMTLANVVPASGVLNQLISEFGCTAQKSAPAGFTPKLFGSIADDTIAICTKGKPETDGALVYVLTNPDAIKYYGAIDGSGLGSPYEFSYVLKSTKAVVISTGGTSSFDAEEITFNILRYKGYDPTRVKLY